MVKLKAQKDSKALDRAEKIAKLLDSSIPIPSTSKTIGVDGLLGLLPGIGDSISSLISGYIVYLAYKDGVPRLATVTMVVNIAIDTIIGSIPLAGDFTDLFWKANIRNVELWKRQTTKRQNTAIDTLFIVATLVALASLVGLVMYATIWLFAIAWRWLNGMTIS